MLTSLEYAMYSDPNNRFGSTLMMVIMDMSREKVGKVMVRELALKRKRKQVLEPIKDTRYREKRKNNYIKRNRITQPRYMIKR